MINSKIFEPAFENHDDFGHFYVCQGLSWEFETAGANH
jgi:hypothetical protein